MKKIFPKMIRDPVHDIIPFEDTCTDRLLLNLIDTREFQRLRRIKQLGMSDMVFPGASHSRFCHAIGAMHVARKILDRAEAIGLSITEEQRTAVLVAALLHDVGHGPFSHAYEKATGDNHEARTLQIIKSDLTEVNKTLREFDSGLPDLLAAFFEEEADASGTSVIPPVLTQIISSQLDADRFDYLLRDSLMTGTDYGKFDLNWLLLQLRYDKPKGRFYLSRKALSAVEAYVYARYHMYRSVYFHKAIRAAEVMLRLIFKRYKELLDGESTEPEKQSVVPDAPKALLQAFAVQASLDNFLNLDDHAVTEFFKACCNAKDTLLRDLGEGLITRKLFKGIDVTDRAGSATPAIVKFTERSKQEVREKGLDPDYAFPYETAADTPYKPYDPDVENPATQIYIQLPTGNIKELSRVSDPVDQLTKEYTLLRYYYPPSIRSEIEKIAKETVLKEQEQ